MYNLIGKTEKAGVIVLITEEKVFNIKSIKRNSDRYLIMIKGTKHQEYLTH